MNTYVTGNTIRLLREAKGLTQAELARQLLVSAKTVSKWETAKGLPDISLLEPLAAALGVSVLELMQGEPVVNRNRAANLLRSKLYVCPLCGNVLHSTGQAVVSCCGITLPALDIAEADDADEKHQLTIERKMNFSLPCTTPWRRATSSPSSPISPATNSSSSSSTQRAKPAAGSRCGALGCSIFTATATA